MTSKLLREASFQPHASYSTWRTEAISRGYRNHREEVDYRYFVALTARHLFAHNIKDAMMMAI